MPQCGCGSSFKRSGLRIHQQRSIDPRCSGPIHTPLGSSSIPSIDGEGWGPTIGELPEEFDMEVDPRGDYFGDYTEYTLEELGMEATNRDESENSDNEEEPEEAGLEPERVAMDSVGSEVEAGSRQDNEGPPTRLRGGAEENSKIKPIATQLTKTT